MIRRAFKTEWPKILNNLALKSFLPSRWQYIAKLLAVCCQAVGNTLPSRWQCSFFKENVDKVRNKQILLA